MGFQKLQVWALALLFVLPAYGQQQGFYSTGASGGTPEGVGESVSYATLRATNCSADDLLSVTDPPATAGSFECQTSDPYSDGDDDGVVIASNNGNWWVRQFAYNAENPVELDWFPWISDGDEITGRLDSIFTGIGASSDLFVRMPTPAVTLRADEWTWTGIDSLYLWENGLDTLKLVDVPTDSEWRMFDLGTFNVIMIGTTDDRANDEYNLWLHGNTEGDLGTGTGASIAKGFVEVEGDNTSEKLEIRANMAWTYRTGFRQDGTELVAGVDTLILEGQYYQSGIFISGGWDHVILDADIRDPMGRRIGWDGTSNADNCDYTTYGMGKNYSLTIQQGTSSSTVEGSVDFTHGGAGAFFGIMGGMGTELAVFDIDQDSTHYSESGERIYDCGAGVIPGWKSDAFKHTAHGDVYIDYSVTGPIPYLGIFLTAQQLECQASLRDSHSAIYTLSGSTASVSHVVDYRNIELNRLESSCVSSFPYGTVGNNNVYGASATEPGDWARLYISHEDSVFSGSYQRIYVSGSLGSGATTIPTTISNAYINNVTADERIDIVARATGTYVGNATMPSTAVLDLNGASITCGNEGTITSTDDDDSNGIFLLSNANDRTTLGATGAGPYVICDTSP